jgi:hypothetical protein
MDLEENVIKTFDENYYCRIVNSSTPYIEVSYDKAIGAYDLDGKEVIKPSKEFKSNFSGDGTIFITSKTDSSLFTLYTILLIVITIIEIVLVVFLFKRKKKIQ